MVKAIVFDVGGVIVSDFSKKIWEEQAKRLSITVPELKSLIREFAVWANVRTKPTVEEFWQLKQGNWKELNVNDLHAVLDSLHGSETLNRDLIKLICSLRKNYKVGILSNVGGDITKLLKSRFKISDIFDFNLASGEIGFAKPDPKIFKHLIDFLNLKPEEIIFIDDKLENVEAAKRTGLLSIRFSDTATLITKLHELEVKW